MILINVDDTFEVQAESAPGVTFTCSPIRAQDMARFMDMSALFGDGGNVVETRLNTRNYEIFAKYVKTVDGITNAKGAKLVWKPDMIHGVNIDVINEVARQILGKSRVSEEQRGN